MAGSLTRPPQLSPWFMNITVIFMKTVIALWLRERERGALDGSPSSSFSRTNHDEVVVVVVCRGGRSSVRPSRGLVEPRNPPQQDPPAP